MVSSSFIYMYIICLILGVIVRTSFCTTDAEDVASIDAFIRDIMVTEEMVGLTVAVVKEGRPLMASGYGIKDLKTLDDVTNETLFYLASCSKAVNSAVLSHLLSEDGRFDFDTRVRDIMPEFALETGYRSEHATIRDLIAHRTGVADSLLSILVGAIPSRDAYVSSSRFAPAVLTFRDGESYNNMMVTIGGRLAGILAGDTWEEIVRQYIFNPLGMMQSTFVQELTQEQYDDMATAHETEDDAPRAISMEVFGENLGPATPSGGIITNAVDMQKWLMFLTNKGLAEDGSRVMNESDLVRTMRETSVAYHVTVPDDPDLPTHHTTNGVALGWYPGTYRGYNRVLHGGFFFGYASLVTVLPDKGMAVYTNINCADGYVNGSVQDRVHYFALDTLLDLPSIDYTEESPAAELYRTDNLLPVDPGAQNYSPVSDGPKRALDEYAGTYGNFLLGNATIIYNSTADELWGTYGTLGVLVLVPGLQNDSFIGIVQEPIWFAPPLTVRFEATDGVYDKMTIPFLIPQAPPTFIRDLQMDDAPPPPTDSCENV